MSQAGSLSSGGSSGGVTSISGTANQITASAHTGSVTLSIPSTFIAPGSIEATASITADSGNVVITAGNLTLPLTTSTTGQIIMDNTLFTHAAGGLTTYFAGFGAGNLTTTGTDNTCVGTDAGQDLTEGLSNAAFGTGALQGMIVNSQNAAFGASAMQAATGGNNTALGFECLYYNTGSANVAVGTQTLDALVGGTNNVAIGYQAGTNYTGSESSNVLITNAGTTGESGAIRIGTNGVQSSCYLQGISGVTVTGTAVLCSAAGQLGTIASSNRYKDNIQPICDHISVMGLKPMSFNYKSDQNKTIQYGLIAEDVDYNFPYLCFYNDYGKPESVKYHELPTFLLLEIQRLNKRIEALETKS